MRRRGYETALIIQRPPRRLRNEKRARAHGAKVAQDHTQGNVTLAGCTTRSGGERNDVIWYNTYHKNTDTTNLDACIHRKLTVSHQAILCLSPVQRYTARLCARPVHASVLAPSATPPMHAYKVSQAKMAEES